MMTADNPIIAEDDDARWQQVQGRDAAADGQFVYAVRTTGVFCRPSCQSRQPRRDNVTFHADAAAAMAAGFRPCRRCHPDRAVPDMSAETSLMAAMAAHIAAHADASLTLAVLAKEAGMSPSHFQRRFKAVMGISPKAHHAAARLALLKQRLRTGAPVLDAAFAAGYGSTSRVYEQVDGSLGMTPAAYRAGGAGEHIVHATRHTVLGPVMMAATARGVCFVMFGEDEAALLEQLASEFPAATIVPAHAADAAMLDAWMAALDAHLSQGAPRPDLPVDLRGTALQLKVWQFLMQTAPGDVLSYTELADRVGVPKAVRAAASACARNRVAVLVPCHRVLRGDGGLGGYRWGLERKRVLLDAERARHGAVTPGDAPLLL